MFPLNLVRLSRKRGAPFPGSHGRPPYSRIVQGHTYFCLWKAFVPLSRYDIEGTTQTVGSLSLDKRTRFPSGNQFGLARCMSGSPGVTNTHVVQNRSRKPQDRTRNSIVPRGLAPLAVASRLPKEPSTHAMGPRVANMDNSAQALCGALVHVHQMCNTTRQHVAFRVDKLSRFVITAHPLLCQESKNHIFGGQPLNWPCHP